MSSNQQSASKPNPPYPLTPSEERPSFTNPPQQLHSQLTADDEIDDWEKDDEDDEDNEKDEKEDDGWQITEKPEETSHKTYSKPTLPASLRAGPPAGSPLRKITESHAHHAISSQTSLPCSSVYSSDTSLIPNPSQPQPPTSGATMQSNNPFLKDRTISSSSSIALNNPNHTDHNTTFEPVELPSAESKTPVDQFSRMSLTAEQRQEQQPPLIPVELDNSSAWQGVFDSNSNSKSISNSTIAPNYQIPTNHTSQPQFHSQMTASLPQSQPEAWGPQESPELQTQHPLRSHPNHAPLIDIEPQFEPPPGPPPTIPSRNTNHRIPNRSGRPQGPGFYNIKQIRWYDATTSKLRTSPILTQNDNGPCPLLALVNALVLSTNENAMSSLIETLKTREQVSPDLLLQAIIDELLSGARGDTSKQLPDVDELLEFLKGLGTGMNVNPKFILSPDQNHISIGSMAHYAGGFEDTKEMRLYSIFNIPLVHGWIPSLEDENSTYTAFSRHANTYEDAQNLQFREQPLEAKLDSEGLSEIEQQEFQDLHSIKAFLMTNSTQLTDFGLKVLHRCITPGHFAILFRNDHFATIYKEPRSNTLMSLVTDAGYASHEEIIWENLVDVSGRQSEMFSGDFRPVSHNDATHQSNNSGVGPPVGPRNSSLATNSNTQTYSNSMLDVDSTRVNQNTAQHGLNGPPPQPSRNPESFSAQQTDTLSPNASRTEQEDHDLALALQLQEEEEARLRRETEARQRNSVLEPQQSGRVNVPIQGTTGNRRRSSAANSRTSNTQGQQPPPSVVVPPRRNTGTTASGTGRHDDEAPPTYEQAAGRPVFNPPSGHPASPGAPLPGAPGHGRGSSALGRGSGHGIGRGRGLASSGGRDRERDCIVM